MGLTAVNLTSLALTFALTLGCAPPPPVNPGPTVVANSDVTPTPLAETTPAKPAPLRHSTDYVIAAGLKWLVVLDTAPLLTHLERVASTWLPKTNVEAFERSVGLRLTKLRNVSIAGFDYSTLYVVRGVLDAQRLRERFTSRMTLEPVVHAIGNQSLYTGTFGDEVEHFAMADDTTALWATADPTPVKAALLRAQGELRRSPSALNGAALQLLPPACAKGHAVVLVPGPIGLPADTEREASLVLDATLALSVRATIESETLVVNLCWLGDWQNDGVTRTKTVLARVLASRFATLLELTPEERQARFTSHGDLVEVEYRWEAPKVLQRLQSVLTLDLQTLFEPYDR